MDADSHKLHRPIWFVREITGLTKISADPVYRVLQFMCESDRLRVASIRQAIQIPFQGFKEYSVGTFTQALSAIPLELHKSMGHYA